MIFRSTDFCAAKSNISILLNPPLTWHGKQCRQRMRPLLSRRQQQRPPVMQHVLGRVLNCAQYTRVAGQRHHAAL